MLQTFVRCIKLGEILLDENRRLLLFCTQCKTDYDLNDFQQHLEYCRSGDASDGHSLQGIFDDNVSFVFPVTKKGQESRHMLARYVNNNGKEFHVYKCNGIKRLDELQQTVQCKTNTNDDDLMDLIKIEEELLDPRWYTELSSTQNAAENLGPQPQSQQKQPASYHELVEAVTPFVHFKENFKTNNDNRKIVKPNIKETPRMKSQILNGVNVPGRTLNKPNEQSSNFTVQSYVITKPVYQTSVTTKTATDMASLNNGNKSINPAVSNSNNTNYNKLSGNNNNVKSPGAKINSVKKLPNIPTVMSSNNKIKPETGNNSIKRPADSNKNCSNRAANSTINSMKLSVDKYRLKLPLLKQITAPNLPATNTAPTTLTPPTTLTAPKSPATPATLQQGNRSTTAATIKTDNQHNRKTTLKRTNESTGGSPSALKQLKPSGCGSSAAGNPAAKICTLKIITTKALPGKTVQTQQILNKLQNLGLQVKIKEPASKQQEPSSTSTKDPEKEKTLQIIKKLQSKGMNVKIIQPSKQDSLSSSVENSHQPDDMQKRKKLEASVSNGQPPPMKRNLIIKKLN